MSVRVRFAPSPTGHVHIGNIRAAIFNWLYARHVGGAFLLRVEDTDRERSTPEAIETLLACMDWMGIDYDEPPTYQSARTARHLAVAADLEARGLAYRENKGGGGECLVFRMPDQGTCVMTDLVKGTIQKQAQDVKDFVIVRSDGSPVFHLANVVDDADMNITHVIRGDDHVENTFKHIALFEAMGAPAPQYAHLPMIVNHMGKPYSKRDGAAFVGDFREQGYLPDALFNYLALLGWSPGDDREIMTRTALVEAFSLDRCLSSAARFDSKKLRWMNGEYIARMPRETYHKAWAGRMRAAEVPITPLTGDLDAVLEQIQPRTKTLADIPGNCIFFFTDAFPLNEAAVNKRLKPEGTAALLEEMAGAFAALPVFDAETTEALVRDQAERHGGMGAVVHPLRVAVSGVTEGPGLFDMFVLIGRERVCSRLRKAAGLAG